VVERNKTRSRRSQAGDREYEDYFGTGTALPGSDAWSKQRTDVLSRFIDDLPNSGISDTQLRTLLAGLGVSSIHEQEKPSLARWKIGHQLFDLLLDGINSTLEKVIEIDAASEPNEVPPLLDKVALLYRASTAAFNYAADFSADEYTNVVRPTMAPPEMASGFSGTLNEKHRRMKSLLVRLSAQLKKVFGNDQRLWPEALQTSFDALIDAKNENLRNHGRICERFVPGGKSLLREFLKNEKVGEVYI